MELTIAISLARLVSKEIVDQHPSHNAKIHDALPTTCNSCIIPAMWREANECERTER